MPIRPRKNISDESVKRLKEKVLTTLEKPILNAFKYAGEQAVGYCRGLNTYMDRSANLRSSTGFGVAKQGEIKVMSNFEQLPSNPNVKVTDALNGGELGKAKLAQSIQSNADALYVLSVVAGMPYAYFVERLYGYEVLSGAKPIVEQSLKKRLSKILK